MVLQYLFCNPSPNLAGLAEEAAGLAALGRQIQHGCAGWNHGLGECEGQVTLHRQGGPPMAVVGGQACMLLNAMLLLSPLAVRRPPGKVTRLVSLIKCPCLGHWREVEVAEAHHSG